MSYIIVSFNHKHCPMSLLEKISFASSDIIKFSSIIMENKNIKEVVILSTCNRVELIMEMSDKQELPFIFSSLASYFSIDENEIKGKGDIYQDNEAISHIFCVASSLDSMVIGETQITGQLKSAFKIAISNKLAGKFLSRLIHFSFKCSSFIRNHSDISKNSVSIASIAILKLEESFLELENKKVIVVGAGEMSSLVVKNLVGKNMDIYLFNRSIENIETFKKQYDKNITIKPLTSLKDYINDIDILFTATGASSHIITDDILKANSNKKVWFDLALPKDIKINEEKHKHIQISSIENLEEIAKKNTALRAKQAKIAHSLIDDKINEFVKWQSGLDVSPVLGKIREKAKKISQDEIKKAIKKKFIKEEDEENIEKLIHVIFNKFLHSTSNNLRKISNEPDVDFAVSNLKFLFSLDEEGDSINQYKCKDYSSE